MLATAAEAIEVPTVRGGPVVWVEVLLLLEHAASVIASPAASVSW
ncbi:MAG: hypothetical protein ABSA53_33140 [Streptosporangiaceae bacterium]